MGLKSRHCATRAYGSATAPPCIVPPAPSVSASLPHSPASRAAWPLPAPAAFVGCQCWVPTTRTATLHLLDRTPSLLLHCMLSRPPLPPLSSSASMCKAAVRPRASLRPRRVAMPLARLKSCCQAPHSLLSVSLATEAAPPCHHSQRWRHHPP
jgi:hypothetical protein